MTEDEALTEPVIVQEVFITGTAVEAGSGYLRIIGWTQVPNLGGEMQESRIAVRAVGPTAVVRELGRQINTAIARGGR